MVAPFAPEGTHDQVPACSVDGMTAMENTEPTDAAPPTLSDPALYFNRELSWLAFNRRVLSEAQATGWPLLERVKFLAIHSPNMDEFFMIRVAGLHDQLEAALIDTSPDGLSPREQLTRIGRSCASRARPPPRC